MKMSHNWSISKSLIEIGGREILYSILLLSKGRGKCPRGGDKCAKTSLNSSLTPSSGQSTELFIWLWFHVCVIQLRAQWKHLFQSPSFVKVPPWVTLSFTSAAFKKNIISVDAREYILCLNTIPTPHFWWATIGVRFDQLKLINSTSWPNCKKKPLAVVWWVCSACRCVGSI